MSERYQTFGWSDHARTHSQPGTGNSYTILTTSQLIDLVIESWPNRVPGAGETGLDRKVLVPVPPSISLPAGVNWLPNIPRDKPLFFCPPRVKLVAGMPLKAEAFQRQEGEDPYVQVYITAEDAKQYGFIETPATKVEIVLYSAEALLENNGKRSTDADWEVVAILASKGDEPMTPLTMARNFLNKPGGTHGEYTAQEFAEAIYFHSQTGIRVK